MRWWIACSFDYAGLSALNPFKNEHATHAWDKLSISHEVGSWNRFSISQGGLFTFHGASLLCSSNSNRLRSMQR